MSEGVGCVCANIYTTAQQENAQPGEPDDHAQAKEGHGNFGDGLDEGEDASSTDEDAQIVQAFVELSRAQGYPA